jgi:RNA polymerase sigma-70 factor (ECF subfamily)
MDLFETKLLADCRKGRQDAFDTLVRTYADRVYGIVLPMVRNREDARDISQEVFLKVYRGIGTFSGQSSLSTWICAIAVNAARDCLRKQSRMSEVPYDETKEQTDCDASERRDRGIVLREALDNIEEEQKEILVLRDMMGFSYDEIAEMLGIVPGTVKSRLSRARSALRELLLRDGGFF